MYAALPHWAIRTNRRAVGGIASAHDGALRSRKAMEELADLLRQDLGLLQGGEVAALAQHGPAADVGVGLLRHRARRAQDLPRELGVAHRYADGLAVADRPG